MLAEDEISIRVGADRVFLRPSLRAATRLNRRFGGLDKLAEAIAAENVTAMAATIAEAQDDHSDLARIIAGMAGGPFGEAIDAMKAPLLQLVALFYGFDPDAVPDDVPAPADDKPLSLGDHYARLYRVATGWLGWPPETAWEATPAEITEAAKGRTELLKAIFGGSDDAAPKATEQSASTFNANLHAFLGKATARHGKAA